MVSRYSRYVVPYSQEFVAYLQLTCPYVEHLLLRASGAHLCRFVRGKRAQQAFSWMDRCWALSLCIAASQCASGREQLSSSALRELEAAYAHDSRLQRRQPIPAAPAQHGDSSHCSLLTPLPPLTHCFHATGDCCTLASASAPGYSLPLTACLLRSTYVHPYVVCSAFAGAPRAAAVLL